MLSVDRELFFVEATDVHDRSLSNEYDRMALLIKKIWGRPMLGRMDMSVRGERWLGLAGHGRDATANPGRPALHAQAMERLATP